GEALLWVYGRMNQTNAPFLVSLLQENWCRVQAISIRKYHSSPLLMHCQGVWDCLQSPADNLQRIHFSITDSDGINLPITLFGNHAPVLKVLHLDTNTYKFNPTASWIRNLSTITFTSAFSTKEVLRALKYMPQLVHLTVLEAREQEGHVENFSINLPHLKMMNVYGELPTITAILESITPSLDCCFSANLSYWSGFEDAVKNEKYEGASTKHIQTYFSHHRPAILHVTFLGNEGITFEDGAPHEGRRFCIPIPVTYHVESSSILKTLIKTGGLSDVKELKLGLWNDFGRLSQFDRILIRLSAMGIFSSVTTLATVDRVLEHVLEDEFFVSQFLPSLTILKVHPCPAFDRRQALPLDPAGYHLFVRDRRTRGRPISVLEIHFRSLYDVYYLEEHVGLIVQAFHLGQLLEEYRCGDRQAERLCFGAMERRRLLLLQRPTLSSDNDDDSPIIVDPLF
ncbi:hypothetical protein CPC08DRAFT_709480, partial [Agrocybe pediades]